MFKLSIVYHMYIDIGYAQGMNDLLARFLVVTDSEVDSYWMFAKYMEYKREDFLEHTMMKKVGELDDIYSCSFGIPVFGCNFWEIPVQNSLSLSLSLSLSFSPALVKKLINEIDLKLYNFFESSECHDYLFCHR